MSQDVTGEKVFARDANKEQKYTCPFCGGETIPKQGEVKIWHYAHKYLGECYWESESEEHEDFKMRLYDLFSKLGYLCDVERITIDRKWIIDLALQDQQGHLIAVEVQLSNYTGEQIIEKTKALNALGYYTLWLVGDPALKSDKERTSGLLYTMHHFLYFGRIYTITKNMMIKVHPSVDPELEISSLYLKYATKTIIKQRFYIPIHSFGLLLTTSRGIKIARFYDRHFKIDEEISFYDKY